MAQKSKSQTKNKSSYRGFEGVDTRKTHSGDESIAMIDNFRITDDGSLKKRSGYKSIVSSTGEIKASYCTTRNGVEVCYYVEGKNVRKYTPSTKTVTTLEKLESSSSRTFFFEYFDNVYICDGETLYRIDDTVYSLSGYIPLYGKDWSNTAGEVNEPINLLSDKIAISYKLGSPATSYLPLGNQQISNIVELYRNGSRVKSDRYSLNTEYNVISLQDFSNNDEFFAILNIFKTPEIEAEQSALLSSRAAEMFYELNENNLFFWGSASNNKIYYTKKPDPSSVEITSRHTDPGSFYVPLGSYLSVASDNDRVNALIRHYDRMMIMTERSTWICDPASLSGSDTPIRSINTTIGAESFRGACRIENTLISIGKSSIYAWTSRTDELNECNAYSISDPINAILPNDFFSSCKIYVYKKMREVWFYGGSAGQVWIYNIDRKAWYKFSGFTPTEILCESTEPRFIGSKMLCCFDDTLLCDFPSDEPIEIIARLKSGELEFNSKHKKKLSGASLRGEFSGGSLNATIMLDGKKSFSTPFKTRAKHFNVPFRIRSGSFYSLTFELIASGSGDQIIHGVEFNAD